MEYKCQFCNKLFASKSNLNTHIKTAKVCINNRGDNKVEVKTYTCEHCNKEFTTKNKLNNHIPNCVEYNNKKIFEKKDLFNKTYNNQTNLKTIVFVLFCFI